MRVNVDEQALNEQRIKYMAKTLTARLGREVSHHEILGRLIRVWMLCYHRRSAVLPVKHIDGAAELDGFAEVMVAEEMADLDDGGVYVCGVQDRIGWLESQAEKGRLSAERRREKSNRRNKTRTTVQQVFKLGSNQPRTTAEQVYKSGCNLSPDPALALSQALDLDQAQDLDPNRIPRVSDPEALDPQAPEIDKLPADAKKPDPPPEALTLAYVLSELILKNHPDHRMHAWSDSKKHDNAIRWAVTIDRMMRIDRRTESEVHGMIEWCQRDPFWSGVILGADNLRDKWEKMSAQRRRPNGSNGVRDTRSVFDGLADAARELNTKEQAK